MKKILIVGDEPQCNSGFSRVVHDWSKALADTKLYDIYLLGINYYGDKPFDTNTFKYVYPTDITDVYGFQKLPVIAKQVEPDLIIIIQDFFHVSRYLSSLATLPPTRILTYVPADADFESFHRMQALSHPHIVTNVSYTNFANTIQGTPDNPVVYHTLDPEQWFPLTKEERIRQKLELGLPADNFTVLSMGNYSHRKGHGIALEAMHQFQQTHPDTTFIMHVPFSNHVMGTSPLDTLPALATQVGFTDEDIKEQRLILSGQIRLDNDRINVLHNAADVFITTNGGEGFGLCPLEAMLTETRVIAPDNTVHKELMQSTTDKPNNGCRLVPATTKAYFPFDASRPRLLPSTQDTVAALEAEYKKWQHNSNDKVLNPDGRKHVSTICNYQTNMNIMKQQVAEAFNKELPEDEEVKKVIQT